MKVTTFLAKYNYTTTAEHSRQKIADGEVLVNGRKLSNKHFEIVEPELIGKVIKIGNILDIII